jgi:hypothetical protein
MADVQWAAGYAVDRTFIRGTLVREGNDVTGDCMLRDRSTRRARSAVAVRANSLPGIGEATY